MLASLIRAAQAPVAPVRRCHHCGRPGTDLERQAEHIGGVGDAVTIYVCRDRAACWQRWEREA